MCRIAGLKTGAGSEREALPAFPCLAPVGKAGLDAALLRQSPLSLPSGTPSENSG